MSQNKAEDETVYPAASHGHCKKMGKKYGWSLKHSKPSGNEILPRNCHFRGKVELPKYNDDKPE